MPTSVQYIFTKEKIAVPLGNFDIHEDETTLVNRLYYALPRFENGRFSCSFYYEENTFRKESNGGFDAGSLGIRDGSSLRT